ncbi:TetR/AcrR family transcriptional regulator [Streptomyces aureocirculatus]|uniref:TetR/AcrR family transcriptional regulator n=1 Tax=Streptomyces aureocirculatus TaxID=67275 RepID=UPI000689E668|nr:TetR/AcrR family transcriptional regulator [Streptomyces aureocirculatus]
MHPPATGSDDPAPRVAPQRRLHPQERREQLLHCALALFAARGPASATLEDLATHAQVSRPLVYRYFPGGKYQLYEAVLGDAAHDLLARLTPPPGGTAEERIAYLLEQYLNFAAQQAPESGILLRGSIVSGHDQASFYGAVRRTVHARFTSCLETGDREDSTVLLMRSWISLVEISVLTRLNETASTPESPQPTPAEPTALDPSHGLADWLLNELVMMFAVAASRTGPARTSSAASPSPFAGTDREIRLVNYIYRNLHSSPRTV